MASSQPEVAARVLLRHGAEVDDGAGHRVADDALARRGGLRGARGAGGRVVRWRPCRPVQGIVVASALQRRLPPGLQAATCRSRTLGGHGEDPLLHAPQRAAPLPGRPARHARGHRARRLRGRRPHGAPRGERDGPLPRAPRVQGRREVRRLPQGQRDRGADGRGAQRLHVARPRRLPHHLPRRGGRRGDRPADRLRRAPEDRPGGARPRARRRDPGDRARERPAVGRRRAPDRPRGVRRPPARAARARARGAPADVLARRDRRLPPAPVGGRARRRLPRRQPRARAREPGAGRDVRPLPVDPGRRRLRAGAGVHAADAGRGSATPTSRTCASPTGRRSTRATSAQRAALAVYGTLLGGSMGSRLFDEIREQRGLAYSVYSVDHAFADVPILQLSAGLESGKCVEAYTRMREIVDELRTDGPREEEVERARAYAAGRRVLAFENTERGRAPRRRRRPSSTARRSTPTPRSPCSTTSRSSRSPRSPAGSPRTPRSRASARTTRPSSPSASVNRRLSRPAGVAPRRARAP